MRVGILEIELHLPGVRSLKEKRGIIKSLTARIRQRFQVAIAEVAHQDAWQSAGLGAAAVGNDAALLQERLRALVRAIEESGLVVLVDFHIEIL
ncbi:MAG: DUF503 domain-containing protein [Magnetococcales bacterium]|nr:DUF503 domain-containing protein [Magnetococcales bacterium]